MASSLSSYVFDDEGMTWITCDLCAGSFQRGSGLCQACHGTKLRRVSYSYLATGSSPPQVQGGTTPPPPPPSRGGQHGRSHGGSSGFSVYGRRS
ncbi:hypothetical protein FOQG_06809 [Fusarium oxysporum f. sp. raphani 54005]|uniref:Uncharacterized protein n=4 Tax=Fusarium oxysporum TaxID=5507 RepID=A0A2H3SN64_FUSOX|nr:hypothetical protein FOQG_06809 [Fusarium oxysporum f. sp. raphani 54005]KAF6516553.1 hypothetical protein HZS61_003756 [Fusarium oxysporum f. sp. conglutinans]KAH7480912.1 hypothetical protein FOMA001_g8491 [Fusarium oxysporum f. sp. matthiolae]RKK78038.1 hypothetical protein BFJ69_g5780 [Fusarium oxysporum]TVY65791.1 hypothetical protein Focb16_v010850 [Fusarium oxysporum f. sp. cubense]